MNFQKKEFMKVTGLKVRAKKVLLQSEEYPFMIADLDGVIYENGEMCIFEAKTASAYKEDVWEKSVPEEYQLQVQHYMAVTGAKKTYIAALVGGNSFFYHVVYRDEEVISMIIKMEKRFWEDNVIRGREPDADGSKATTEFINQKYGVSNGSVVELPQEALFLFQQYDLLSEKLESLKEQKDKVSNQLKNFLKENEVGVLGERKVTWKQVTTTQFDKILIEKGITSIKEKIFMKNTLLKVSIVDCR